MEFMFLKNNSEVYVFKFIKNDTNKVKVIL